MNNLNDNQSPTRLPLSKALLWIFLSVLFVSGFSFIGFLYFQHIRENRRHDPRYKIVALVQTSQDKENLKTAFLAELLDLSVDMPKNLYAFNTKDALSKLLRFSVIKSATINKIKPGTIWVDYSLRKPVAYLADFSNTLIDSDGVPFPLKPFFTPKTLPEIYLGLTDDVYSEENASERGFQWGTPLQSKKINLAFSLLNLVSHQCCNELSHLSRIDVSKAFALSHGQRQIVITFEDHSERDIDGQPVLNIHPRIVRLSTDNYAYQLKNYQFLQSHLRQQENQTPISPEPYIQKAKPTIIDMRLTDLGFIYTAP